MVHQNLVIPEVVGWVEHEELMLKLVPEGDHHLALEDHKQFIEVLSPFDYALVRDVDTAVQRDNKEGDELITCIIALVSEDVLELSFEVSKQLTHKFKSKAGLQLLQELLALLNSVLIEESLCLNVGLNALVQTFRQLLLLLHFV